MIQTSIVIPTHNDRQCVQDCIDAIIENTDNYEIIFVLDDSVEFQKELKQFGKVVKVNRPFIFADRINEGIAVAEGEYIVILNDDTMPRPGWLEAMIETDRIHGPALVGARCQPFGCHNPDAHTSNEPVAVQFTKHTINLFAALVSRRFLDVVGPLDVFFNTYGGDDDDFYLRARRHGFKTLISSGLVLHKKSVAFGHERIAKELPETRERFRAKWGERMPITLDEDWGDLDRGKLTLPLVSIIMPTRNHHDHIQKAIISILGQTYKNFELLVGVDGEDQEDTMNVLAEIDDSRIRKYHFEKQVGSCAVRNQLCSMAKGEFIALMDSDDVMLPDRIADQVEAMDPWTDVIHTAFIIEDKEGNMQTHKALPVNREMLLALTSYVAGGTMMLRRHVIENEPFSEEHERAFDFEFALRMMDKLRFKFLPKPSLVYRRHGGEHLSGNTESRKMHFDVINQYKERMT